MTLKGCRQASAISVELKVSYANGGTYHRLKTFLALLDMYNFWVVRNSKGLVSPSTADGTIKIKLSPAKLMKKKLLPSHF